MAGFGAYRIRDVALLIAPKNEAAALAALRRYGARLLESNEHPLGVALAAVASVGDALALLGLASRESPMAAPLGAIAVTGMEEQALATLAPYVAAGSFIAAEAVSGGAFTFPGAWDVRSWRWEFRDGTVYRRSDGDFQTEAGIETALHA
jgi:hypothetical protein